MSGTSSELLLSPSVNFIEDVWEVLGRVNVLDFVSGSNPGFVSDSVPGFVSHFVPDFASDLLLSS